MLLGHVEGAALHDDIDSGHPWKPIGIVLPIQVQQLVHCSQVVHQYDTLLIKIVTQVVKQLVHSPLNRALRVKHELLVDSWEHYGVLSEDLLDFGF